MTHHKGCDVSLLSSVEENNKWRQEENVPLSIRNTRLVTIKQ